MLFANFFNVILWGSLIEFGGALLIVGYILLSLFVLFKHKDITRARLVAADGVITGLSFKLAATLLKTLSLQSWQQIAMFAAIFALRIILKRLFVWERQRLQQREQAL